jgi:phosphatidylglycerol:prolipoprotein diacylglycerol transferase
MVSIGILLGLLLLKVTAPLAGAAAKNAFDLAFWLIIIGLFGSRAAYILTHLDLFSNRKMEMLMYWRGGLMFQGGLIAGMALAAALALKGRIRLLVMADTILPCLALGQAIGRIGCFLAGCCFGFPVASTFPFGVIFPPNSLAPSAIALYPTQLMESLGLFLITIILLIVLAKLRRRTAGLVASLYLILTGALRFYIDFYRADFRGHKILGIPPTSWMAIFLVLSGFFLALHLYRKNKRTNRLAKILLPVASPSGDPTSGTSPGQD